MPCIICPRLTHSIPNYGLHTKRGSFENHFPLPRRRKPPFLTTLGSPKSSAAGRDPFFDDYSGMGPFERMEREMREMDRQFDEMQKRMDAKMDEALENSEKIAKRAGNLDSGGAKVRVERREERSGGSYSYYESVVISGGDNGVYLNRQGDGGLGSVWVVFAAILACVYSFCTYVFNRNYEITKYKQSNKWRLMILWPFLVIFNARFRAQFWDVVRGRGVNSERKSGVNENDNGFN